MEETTEKHMKKEHELTPDELALVEEMGAGIAATRQRHATELATVQGEMSGAVRVMLRARGIKDCHWGIVNGKLVTEEAQ